MRIVAFVDVFLFEKCSFSSSPSAKKTFFTSYTLVDANYCISHLFALISLKHKFRIENSHIFFFLFEGRPAPGPPLPARVRGGPAHLLRGEAARDAPLAHRPLRGRRDLLLRGGGGGDIRAAGAVRGPRRALRLSEPGEFRVSGFFPPNA